MSEHAARPQFEVPGISPLREAARGVTGYWWVLVYQAIENYVLQPTIIGRAVQISGFTVLVSVLAFGALFGLIGAIIGVPIAAGLQIVLAELTASRRAGIAAEDAAGQP